MFIHMPSWVTCLGGGAYNDGLYTERDIMGNSQSGSARSGKASSTEADMAEVRLESRGKSKGRLTVATFDRLRPFMKEDYGPGDQWTGAVMSKFFSDYRKWPKDIGKTLVFRSSKKTFPHLPTTLMIVASKDEKRYYVTHGQMNYILRRR